MPTRTPRKETSLRNRILAAGVLALALPIALAVASPSVAAPASSKTVTVKGHVKSSTGKAIPGVTVSVYSAISGHDVVARSRTSRTGRYEIKIAESEWSYQLKVYDHGDADADDGDGEWAATLKRFDFVGSSFKVDEVLHHGARVAGRVYDRDGEPVGAGVRVGAGNGIAATPGADTITRADGTYLLTNAPAGAGYVGFTSPRTDESIRWYSKSSIYGTTDSTHIKTLSFVYGKRTIGIDFQFPYLGRIAGDTTVDGDHPSEEGSPVLAVLLDPKGIELYSSLANPEFGFSNLAPGTYYLKFRAGVPEDELVTEYYKDSATLEGAVPLVIGAKGTAITGFTAALSSK